MKSNLFKQVFALLLSVSFLAGCESLATDDSVAEDGAAPAAEQGAAETTGAPDDAAVDSEEMAAKKAQEMAMKEQAALREVRTFYFDFDQSSIKQESRAALTAHAAFLAANPSSKIVLEGHCDERGTKEYNIALGESRAKSVASFLKVNGVSDAQIETISYGEERPADAGRTEAAWAQNRRVYLEYK